MNDLLWNYTQNLPYIGDTRNNDNNHHHHTRKATTKLVPRSTITMMQVIEQTPKPQNRKLTALSLGPKTITKKAQTKPQQTTPSTPTRAHMKHCEGHINCPACKRDCCSMEVDWGENGHPTAVMCLECASVYPLRR